jgi:hypothetical protein
MGRPRRALIRLVSVLVVALWIGLCPNVVEDPRRSAVSPAASVRPSPPLAIAGTPTVDGAGALLRPAPVSTAAWAPGQDCSLLSTAGFTARCGTAANLVWLVEARKPGTGPGWRGSIFRLTGAGTAEKVLQTSDADGLGLGEVRTSVVDVSGDGVDDIVLAFYRLGAGDVLSVDVVEAPGRVTVHRDYPDGSARATRGQLDGWANAGAITADSTLLAHEAVRFTDGSWRVAAFDTAPSSTVYGRDFPDPYVLRVGSTYYGYATNASGSNVPMIRSSDLRTWSRLRDALPQLPAWSAPGRVWAPSVLPRPGGYVLYYATRNVVSGQQCVSRAWSTSPVGPFVDDSTAGLVCQADRGGSIDASPFVDADGTPWLYWKSDGTPGGEGPQLWSQPLSPDGLSLAGAPTSILGEDQPWETPVVEGPSMVRDGDRYYLFYVAGPWQTAGYAIGYATCASPKGPCTKAQDRPLLASSGSLAGPGGPEFVVDEQGQRWMSFHGWAASDVGYPRGRRMLFLTPVRFDGGRPVVGAAPLQG